MRRWTRRFLVVVTVALLAAAGFAVGRTTARGPQAGDYLDGLRAGRAEGRLEGRAEQEGAALPAGDRAAVRNAFTAGYAAGTDDVFAGYDGGWALGVPWIVTLAEGTGGAAYRIASRTPVEPGVSYSLCSDGTTLCQEAR
jgi:hypothetical protein